MHQYLSKLVLDGKIEVKENRHSRIGLPTRLNPNDYQNTETNLDNWRMFARITEASKDKIQSSKKMWYDTENARRQFEDYPQTKQRTIRAFTLSIIVRFTAFSADTFTPSSPLPPINLAATSITISATRTIKIHLTVLFIGSI